MADFSALKSTIQSYIKQNGNEEITGTILQDILLAMVQSLGDSAINGLVSDLASEATARQNADGTLNNSITAINNAISNGMVYAGIATPTGTPSSGKVFYIALQAGTYTNFGNKTLTQGINILKYNGSSWTLEQIIGFDDYPTANSQKLVKSGGVDAEIKSLVGYYTCGTAAATAEKTITSSTYILLQGGGIKVKFTNANTADDATLKIGSADEKPLYYSGRRAGSSNSWLAGEVVEIFYDGTNYYANSVAGGNGSGDGAFDISVYNAVGGTPAQYAGFANAVTNANVPTQFRKGGMTVRFIDNTVTPSVYVQYRLMKTTWSTTITDWQGTTDKVKAGSRDLVESGGVMDAVDNLRVADASIINNSNMFKDNVVEQTESLSGYTISASTGAIVASSVSGSSVDYIPVNAGDIIRIKATPTGTNRVAYGLYSAIAADTVAIDYMAFAGPIESGFDKLFICNASGYFAIYTLNPYSLYKVKSKILEDDYVTNVEAGRFNVYDGGVNVLNGKVVENATRQYTDYIDISLFNELVYTRSITTGSPNIGLCFYSDKNENSFISGIKEVNDAAVPGYIIDKAVIPDGAVYVRFTFWKNKDRGNFFFGDPTRDPVIAKLMKVSDRQSFVNSSVIYFDGQNNTFAYSDVLYVNENQKVLKFIVKDPDYSRNNATSGVVFGIYAYDASDNVIMRLAYVDYSGTIDKEYICVIPEGTTYFKIGGKCDVGYSCICDIIDITNEYLHTNVYNDVNNFITYKTATTAQINRALLNLDVKSDLIVYVGLKNPESVYQYTVTGYSIDAEHAYTGTTLIEYGNTVAFCKEIKVTDFKYIGVFIRNDTGTITKAVSVEDIVNDLEIKVMSKDDFKLTIGENTKDVMLCGLKVESDVLKTDFNVKTKEHIKMRVYLPEWLKVRFYKGLREGRSYTSYYYNGDMVELDRTAGFIQVNVSRLDERSYTQQPLEYFQELINDGKIKFEVQDVSDKTVVDRNFDAEKYIGAITSTPYISSSTPYVPHNLPVIVHTSDSHGDAERLKNVHDWADHIGANLVVNTGDNPFYLMDDGINFVKEIVFAHKTDFANCLGNHDTYDTSGGVAGYTQKNIGVFAETYHYYKEVVNGEPVVTDTAYYYKDLEEQKLRIIAVNEYDGVVTSNYKARISKTQIDWFIDTLASTPEDYGVIILMHQVPHTLNAISGKTNFNDATMNKGDVAEDEWQCSGIDSDYMTNAKVIGNPFGKIIDAFIDRGTVSDSYTQKTADMSASETVSYSADFSNVAPGVEFIMYLNGHTHRDFVGYVADCDNNQLNINVCSTSGISQSNGFKSPADIMRGTHDANQDAFNVYTVDRSNKRVGIARVGANLSNNLIDRKVMWVSYAD